MHKKDRLKLYKGSKHSQKMTRRESEVMKDPEYQKELMRLKRKYSVPVGKRLENMLSTEEGKRKYEEREARWQAFRDKWNIVFFIGDKPIIRTMKGH